jgi:hypothetical protein
MQQLHDIRQHYVQTLADHGTALPNMPQIKVSKPVINYHRESQLSRRALPHSRPVGRQCHNDTYHRIRPPW